MTLHSFRRRSRAPDWDATTIPFAGASGPAPAPVTMTRAAPRTALDMAAPPDPPPPQRPYDAAMPAILRDGAFGLLCGMDRWRIHFDPEAAHYRHMFDALRVSALRAGWVPDAYGRWCCPRCQDDPFYAAYRPLAHYHPGVPHARTGADPFESVRFWLARPATEYHEDAAAAFAAGDPAAEFWFRVEPEPGVLARTAQGAVHGRHEAGAR